MRLRRQREPRRLTAPELTRPEKSKNDLQARLEISDAVKRKMLEVRTFGTLDKRATQKGQAVINLLVLFPEEKHKILQDSPNQKLEDVADPKTVWDKAYKLLALDILSRLGHVVTVEPAQAKWFLSLLGLPRETLQNNFLEAVKVRNHCKQVLGQEALPNIDPRLDEWIKEMDWEKSVKYAGGFLLYASVLLRHDPSLHGKLHKLAVANEAQIKSVLKRLGEDSEPEVVDTLVDEYATFKLLLADEIQVSPTGILFPVDSAYLKQGPELPERDLA